MRAEGDLGDQGLLARPDPLIKWVYSLVGQARGHVGCPLLNQSDSCQLFAGTEEI